MEHAMNDKKLPELGFWQHYKHDPKKEWCDKTYYFVNYSLDSDTDGFRGRYLPLYEETGHLGPAKDYSISVERWMSEVEVHGKMVPRYTRVTDPEPLRKLEAKRKEKYGI